MERVDIAIVGSGPAGLSAALNAKIRNKSFIVFGNNNLSNKVTKASKINNYLGFYGVTGKELGGIIEQLRLTDGVEVAIFLFFVYKFF